MKSHIPIPKKSTTEQAPNSSNAPARGMFQERSLKQAESSQQVDLKTSLMQAQRYGHHPIQMQPKDFSPVLQPIPENAPITKPIIFTGTKPKKFSSVLQPIPEQGPLPNFLSHPQRSLPPAAKEQKVPSSSQDEKREYPSLPQSPFGNNVVVPGGREVRDGGEDLDKLAKSDRFHINNAQPGTTNFSSTDAALTVTATSMQGNIYKGVGDIAKGYDTLMDKDKTMTDKGLAATVATTSATKEGTAAAATALNPRSQYYSQALGTPTQTTVGGVSEIFGAIANFTEILLKIKEVKQMFNDNQGEWGKVPKFDLAIAGLGIIEKTVGVVQRSFGATRHLGSTGGAKDAATVADCIDTSLLLFKSLVDGINQLREFWHNYQDKIYSDENEKSRKVKIAKDILSAVETVRTISFDAATLAKTITFYKAYDPATMAQIADASGALQLIGGTLDISKGASTLYKGWKNKKKLQKLIDQNQEQAGLTTEDSTSEVGEEQQQKTAAAYEHIKSTINKQQRNAGIDAILGAANIVGGSLVLSGFGLIPGAIIAGSAVGIKLSRVGFNLFRQHKRDKKQAKYDKRIDILKEISVDARVLHRNTGTESHAVYARYLEEKIQEGDAEIKGFLKDVQKHFIQTKLPLFTSEQINTFIEDRDKDKGKMNKMVTSDRSKSSKEKQANYELTAETIQDLQSGDVDKILGINRDMIAYHAEHKFRKDSQKNNLPEEQIQEQLSAEIAKAVRDKIIEKLKKRKFE